MLSRRRKELRQKMRWKVRLDARQALSSILHSQNVTFGYLANRFVGQEEKDEYRVEMEKFLWQLQGHVEREWDKYTHHTFVNRTLDNSGE